MSIIGAILYFLGCVAAGGAAGFAAGSTIAWAIGKIIDADTLKDEVKVKYQDALKLRIQEKKKNAVNVGIFGENEDCIEDSVDITSDKGVSDELYVGQVILL